jgi:hypothetical protein
MELPYDLGRIINESPPSINSQSEIDVLLLKMQFVTTRFVTPANAPTPNPVKPYH